MPGKIQDRRQKLSIDTVSAVEGMVNGLEPGLGQEMVGVCSKSILDIR